CGARCDGMILLIVGRPNAVVLPVPVRDWTSRSLPSLTGLYTAVWTAVGAKYPISSSASLTSGCSPRSSKLGGAGSAGSAGSMGSAGSVATSSALGAAVASVVSVLGVLWGA